MEQRSAADGADVESVDSKEVEMKEPEEQVEGKRQEVEQEERNGSGRRRRREVGGARWQDTTFRLRMEVVRPSLPAVGTRDKVWIAGWSFGSAGDRGLRIPRS